MQVVDDLVLVTTDEGFIYGFGQDGSLTGTVAHDSTAGPPSFGDVDEDGVDELVVPLADATVVVRDRPSLPPPSQVWDVPCPSSPETCQPAADLDSTESITQLCAQWFDVPGVDGYDTRVLGTNGTEIRPWATRGRDTVSDYAGLSLVPGTTYTVEVRAWRIQDDGRLEFSAAIGAQGGVRVISPAAPEITRLDGVPEVFPEGMPITIQLEARDEDRIAGWSLAVHQAGEQVLRLFSGALSHRVFRGEHTWDGTDRAGERLPEGCYEVVAMVVDRAGQATSERRGIVFGDGACPED